MGNCSNHCSNSSAPPSEDEDIEVNATCKYNQSSLLPSKDKKASIETLETGDVESRTYRAVPLSSEIAAQSIKVLLVNGAKRLGIDVRKQRGSPERSGPAGLDLAQCIVVTAIAAGGLGEEWNEKHPEAQLSVGDFVVQVNGTACDANAMMDAWRTSRRLDLRVVKQ